jgi:hypothetical protein
VGSAKWHGGGYDVPIRSGKANRRVSESFIIESDDGWKDGRVQKMDKNHSKKLQLKKYSFRASNITVKVSKFQYNQQK